MSRLSKRLDLLQQFAASSMASSNVVQRPVDSVLV